MSEHPEGSMKKHFRSKMYTCDQHKGLRFLDYLAKRMMSSKSG